MLPANLHRNQYVIYGLAAAVVVCVVIIVYLFMSRPKQTSEFEMEQKVKERAHQMATHLVKEHKARQPKKIQPEPVEENTSDPSTPSKPMMVLFYMNGCGPCNALKPHWEQFEDAVNPSGQLEALKFEASQYSDVMRQADVKGFPTVRLYPEGFTPQNPNRPFVEYSGPRTFEGLMQFIQTGGS